MEWSRRQDLRCAHEKIVVDAVLGGTHRKVLLWAHIAHCHFFVVGDVLQCFNSTFSGFTVGIGCDAGGRKTRSVSGDMSKLRIFLAKIDAALVSAWCDSEPLQNLLIFSMSHLQFKRLDATARSSDYECNQSCEPYDSEAPFRRTSPPL